MRDLSVIDGIGFVAAALVLATFCMRSMTALRWVALASNLAFIAYAYLGNLAPVLLLHALLLPVNACRLAQLCGSQARREPSEKRDERATASDERQPFSIVGNDPMQDSGFSRVQCASRCGPYKMVVRIKEPAAVSKLW